MTRNVTGSKYEPRLTATEIAKRLREEVKAAKKAGELPKGLKVSIRSRYYSGGCSIDMEVKELGFPLVNEEWVKLEMEEPHRAFHPSEVKRYTAEALEVEKKLEAMHRAYNYDKSDIMTDYFNVNYYGGVTFDYELANAERAAIEELLKLRAVVAKRATEAAAEMVAEGTLEPAAEPSAMEGFLEMVEAACLPDRTKAEWNF